MPVTQKSPNFENLRWERDQGDEEYITGAFRNGIYHMPTDSTSV